MQASSPYARARSAVDVSGKSFSACSRASSANGSGTCEIQTVGRRLRAASRSRSPKPSRLAISTAWRQWPRASRTRPARRRACAQRSRRSQLVRASGVSAYPWAESAHV